MFSEFLRSVWRGYMHNFWKYSALHWNTLCHFVLINRWWIDCPTCAKPWVTFALYLSVFSNWCALSFLQNEKEKEEHMTFIILSCEPTDYLNLPPLPETVPQAFLFHLSHSLFLTDSLNPSLLSLSLSLPPFLFFTSFQRRSQSTHFQPQLKLH